MDDVPTGKVRWRRTALLLVPSAAISTLVVALTAQGSVAASLAVAGDAFKVRADRLDGTGLVQFTTVDKDASGRSHHVLATGIGHARLHEMCVSVLTDTPLGAMTLVLRSGRGKPVEAEDLVLDLTRIDTDATFDGLVLGRDGASLSGGPRELLGRRGQYGQQARHLELTDFRLHTHTITAGAFKFKGLDIAVKPGRHECF
ncbi:DUF6230 family protein [Thermomonospora umbrina]|uniref:Cholesterol esterase n=1 Tax=Thermomonospora umbrina TaxID=111806 RepID=A0A3D9SH41_9ACTN|nr:DUF6230 family protein [Thermomonospora umbrina]REE95222.1 hypothetical protein DFJ69_0605 [Thermomonospora umbrina]